MRDEGVNGGWAVGVTCEFGGLGISARMLPHEVAYEIIGITRPAGG